MTETATAFWTVAVGRGELRPTALETDAEDAVTIRALFSGVSRGTESLVFSGDIPDSEFQRMRAPFQEGAFPFPVKYGYASVGQVEEGPIALLDRWVFCLFPHQDRYRVPIEAVTVLPADLPPARAVLAANMETALNACWDAGIAPGDRVTVIGAGVVGALVAWLSASIPGTDTTLVDINPERADLAATLGLRFANPDQAAANQDVVIHASGSEVGLVRALELAGFEARVIELSWFGNQRPALPLGQAFHSQRLELRCSQVGHLPAERRARWNHRRRLAKALELLTDPRLDALISGESDFCDLPEVMPDVLAAGANVLCHRVKY